MGKKSSLSLADAIKRGPLKRKIKSKAFSGDLLDYLATRYIAESLNPAALPEIVVAPHDGKPTKYWIGVDGKIA
jgi:hypothetical protein